VRVVLIQKRPKRLRGHPSWFTHSIGKNCAIIAKMELKNFIKFP